MAYSETLYSDLTHHRPFFLHYLLSLKNYSHGLKFRHVAATVYVVVAFFLSLQAPVTIKVFKSSKGMTYHFWTQCTPHLKEKILLTNSPLDFEGGLSTIEPN